MDYHHVQRAPTFWLLVCPAVACLAAAGLMDGPWGARLVTACIGGLLLLLSAGFARLEVRDAHDVLAITFGPLPLLRRRVPYARMRAAHRERSRFLDGWGVHWAPDRGWIWNLWGRDCVAIELDRGRLRIGTDDPEGLLRFLEARIGRETA